jgi:hypothetical protein
MCFFFVFVVAFDGQFEMALQGLFFGVRFEEGLDVRGVVFDGLDFFPHIAIEVLRGNLLEGVGTFLR